ncbi:hypothetical protein K353_04856 [Kitasatospora sp. SolWspMP-SS2h]|uniref:hypothetical protein n=1 Tax=Kitasatospora sp. SolWspMP-SS2h TaxID=1305729 RepID=UPI000DB9B449|nr:hypothetical protein [Kitasatospora sp. SolWspMP-SS2h]RAJ36116.1 hypothetical protein K353_04856 [Kitasatospora sp. SolWspMP-SS2h]
MALNIRIVTIAVLGALTVGGVATAAELAGPARPGAVVTADGAVAGGPQQPGDAAAQNAVVGGGVSDPSPVPSGSPTPTSSPSGPQQSGTWGWG